MLSLLREFADIFTWSHEDMSGVFLKLVKHCLSLQKGCKLVRQRLRQFHLARQEVIKKEVDKLLAVGFIKEILYPKWLSNMVVVPKKNEKWHVCVDYTNLNNVCHFCLGLIRSWM